MTLALHGTGGSRPRGGAKRPPGGAAGRCRCWRTGGVFLAGLRRKAFRGCLE